MKDIKNEEKSILELFNWVSTIRKTYLIWSHTELREEDINSIILTDMKTQSNMMFWSMLDQEYFEWKGYIIFNYMISDVEKPDKFIAEWTLSWIIINGNVCIDYDYDSDDDDLPDDDDDDVDLWFDYISRCENNYIEIWDNSIFPKIETIWKYFIIEAILGE